MIYVLIFGVLLWLLPLFLLADYWAIKYAATRGISRWRQLFVWVVLAFGVACYAESGMRRMLLRPQDFDYPFKLLVTVPISLVLISIAMAIGMWRVAHTGGGPFSAPTIGINRSGEK